MRESPKYERTHLPQDSYEEWFGTQHARPAKAGQGKNVVEDSYEAWMARLVEKQTKKGPRGELTIVRSRQPS